MLSAQRIKELCNDPAMTDQDAEEIRDGFRALAEVIFQVWQKNRRKFEQVKS